MLQRDEKTVASTQRTGALRIGVAGVGGRMGRLVAEEVTACGCVLAGGLARHPVPGLAARLFATADALAEACDVMVDFTHANTAEDHADALAGRRCAWVLGTTGLSAAAEAAVLAASRQVPVVWAANFSPGVTLLLDVARRLAAALPGDAYDAEVLEMHHRGKRDAPSGTALALARAVADGRGEALLAAPARHGQTGPRTAGEVGFAALRGGQVVGEHTLLFAGEAEHIMLTHKALDRRVFARGAVQAALWTSGRAPGRYGMEDVLGLAGVSIKETRTA